MDPVIYEDADKYILSAATLEERIEKMGQVITGLMNMAITAASSGNFSEYSLNDGQTQIRTVYRNMTEVKGAIAGFQEIEQMLINRLNNNVNGRVIRLVDGKNFH